MTQRINTLPHIGIGVDCGTSGIRAVALSESQHLITEIALSLTEQTPAHWWQTTLKALDQLFAELAQQVDLTAHQIAISADATSSSLFLMSQEGIPLTPVQMYYDSCPEMATDIQPQLNAGSGAQGAQSSLVKALTLKHSLTDQSTPTTDWLVCHQADWLIYQLSGQLGVSDENNCLKLGYDPVQQCWEQSSLDLIGEAHLPKVFPPATRIGKLKSNLCQRWKLPHSTQIATGTTDSIAAFLATGSHELGDAVVSLGSTLAFKLLTHRPYFDAEKGIYSHRLWQQWLVGGASNSGGACLLEVFELEQLKQLAQEQLIQPSPMPDYYPLPKQRTGERFPIKDSAMRALPIPDNFSNTEYFSTLIHGLVLVEQQAWQLLSEGCEQPIRHLYACGGGNKNPAWAGLRKSVLLLPHSKPFSEQAAVGTAMIALKALTDVT